MITRKEANARVIAGGTITFQELTELTSQRGSWSAEDSERLLNACPEWLEQDQLRREKHAARVAALQLELAPEEAPLARDLAAVGCKFDDVWDMVNTPESYPEAIPVLLKHLPRVMHRVMRQGIGRALAVVEAKGTAAPVLLAELRRETDPETRWVFANTLTIVAEPRDTADLRALVADPAYADVHERLRQALKNVT